MGEHLMSTKCNSCGGIYDTAAADGSRYFHACPPIANPTYQPDPSKKGFDPQLTIEQPNKRDENFSHIDPVTQLPVIKSDGLGVTVS
jgi:hypothetical protein